MLAGLTFVNVPAAMISLPTCVIAFTEPFITCGVKVAGAAETTVAPWSALTAEDGAAASPTMVRPAAVRMAP